MALAVCVAPAAAGWAQTDLNFYATRLIGYDPGPGNAWFDDPTVALGGPGGFGPFQGGYDVVTLGEQGSITLGFDEGLVIADGDGPDFIVFENPFDITYGDFSGRRYAELIRVQVSSDGASFAEFPTWCAAANPGSPLGGIDPSLVSGFAGVTPVWADPYDPTNPYDPFDPDEAGGDAFDLADLQTAPEVTAGLVQLDRIRYVRLVDVRGDGSESDSFGSPIYDAWGSFEMHSPDWTEYLYQPVSADVDAISVIHGGPEPHDGPAAGDADEDGDVDFVDYLTLKGNLGTGPGAGWPDGDFTDDGFVNRDDFLLLQQYFGTHTSTLMTIPTAATAAVPAPAVPEPNILAVLAIGSLAALRRRRNGPRKE